MKQIKIKSTIDKPGCYDIWIDGVKQNMVTNVKISDINPNSLPTVEVTYITNDIDVDIETNDDDLVLKNAS